MKNIVVVVHKYLPQPDDDLVYFLSKKRKSRVLHIKHSFPDANDRRSSYSLFEKGKLIKSGKTIDYKFLPEPFIYLKEFIFTIKWVVFSKTKWDICIGMDGLCTFFGLILKRIGLCKKNIYWCMDFVPLNRFKGNWKNYIYSKINLFAVKYADEVWDLSPRMAEGRKEYFGINPSDYRNHKIVPYGVWTKRIRKYRYEDCQKNTLVFMGHILPKQGIDTVLRKISQIVKEIPDFKFKIIGDGFYKENLIKLTQTLKVEKYCNFMGKIEDNRDLENEIAKSAVAIAPYLKLSDSSTYFADSGKIKTYLACGVPVLLTDFTWNVKEIEKKKCGLIIRDDGADLVEKLQYCLQPMINRKFRENAIKYSKDFDYEKIFSVIRF